MPHRRDNLRITTSTCGEEAVIVPAGELDLATAPRLEKELVRQTARTRSIVVDLRRLTFLDVTGLRLLLKLQRQAARDGWRLTVVRGRGAVARVCEVTRAEAVLPMVDAPGQDPPRVLRPRARAHPDPGTQASV
jgi:anti-sigma B factor antagonist